MTPSSHLASALLFEATDSHSTGTDTGTDTGTGTGTDTDTGTGTDVDTDTDTCLDAPRLVLRHRCVASTGSCRLLLLHQLPRKFLWYQCWTSFTHKFTVSSFISWFVLLVFVHPLINACYYQSCILLFLLHGIPNDMLAVSLSCPSPFLLE